MTKIDVAALTLAIERAKCDPERKGQIESMLADDPWIEVAMFAAYHCQYDALRLAPWQPTPSWIDDTDETLAIPQRFTGAGDHEAARLLKRMFALGISRYHPDPLAAIEDKTSDVRPSR